MKLLVAQFVSILSQVLPLALGQKPAVPLSSSGRWIVGTDDQRVKLRCINWPGHMEPNVPEGLSKQSLDHIADWIPAAGFNCVRLTFSIDMALDPDVDVQESFQRGAASANLSDEDTDSLMQQYSDALDLNPWLEGSSRLDVFDRVQAALWDRGVMTIIDNHVSKAKWCCNLDDGNGWWKDAPGYISANSEYFVADDWLEGLQAMAEWTVGRDGIVGLSLRNELRAHVTQIPFAGDQWLQRMPEAARAVHEANPDLLISIGGLDGGNNLGTLRDDTFNTTGWDDKRIWDAHAYPFTVNTPDAGSCDVLKQEFGFLFGFVLSGDNEQQGPLWLSEFGVQMTGGDNDGLSDDHNDWLKCFVEYLESNDADWALWSIAGSYYVREGEVDREDLYAALDKDWNDWRNPKFKEKLGKMWAVTQLP